MDYKIRVCGQNSIPLYHFFRKHFLVRKFFFNKKALEELTPPPHNSLQYAPAYVTLSWEI